MAGVKTKLEAEEGHFVKRNDQRGTLLGDYTDNQLLLASYGLLIKPPSGHTDFLFLLAPKPTKGGRQPPIFTMAEEKNKAMYRAETFAAGSKLNDRYLDCSFFLAEMRQCVFTGHFNRCDFSSASFQECTFLEAVFEDCKFNSAFLRGNNFRKTKLLNCDLRNASLINNTGMVELEIDRHCLLDDLKGVTIVNKNEGGGFLLYSHRLNEGNPPQKAKMFFPNVNPEDWDDEDTEPAGPEPLPPVEHYRSPPIPMQGESSLLPASNIADPFEVEEEYHWACGWGNYKTQATWHQEYLREKARWGYGENAVLETSDIELIRSFKRNG